MSGPRLVGGIAVGVALGTLLGFYVLAPNVEGGPGSADTEGNRERAEISRNLDEASAGLDADDAVLDGVSRAAVQGTFKDQSVLIIALPGADPMVSEAQRELLSAAGATDAGTLVLSEDVVSPDKADAVKSMAASTLPAGSRISEQRRDPGYHLGQLLGQALRTAGGNVKEASASDRDLVLGSLDRGGFVDGELPALKSADAVVVLASEQTGYAGTFTADLAAGLDATTGGVVLAGDRLSARDGGAIADIREDRADTENVSTVDNADRAAGRITVVRALAAQLKGKAGAYGAAESAVAPTL